MDLIDPKDFLVNEFLTKFDGQSKMSSSMFDCAFVASRTVPASVKKAIQDSAEQIALLQTPLCQKTITKNYWPCSMHLEVYGSICLSADRLLLDFIIANGLMMSDAHKYTLRQVVEGGIDSINEVDWSMYNNQKRIDEIMSNKGTYFHISKVSLLKLLGLSNQSIHATTIRQRLDRLRVMELRVTPVVDGDLLANKRNDFHILNNDTHFIFDPTKVKNDNYNNDTFTDIIINVDDYYLDSLEDNGIISRSRMQNHYPHLIGKNNIEDFYMYLDSHSRSFIHNKKLSKMIIDYYDYKISSFGQNRSYKLKQVFKQVLADKEQDKLREHFGITLVKLEVSNPIFQRKSKSDPYLVGIDFLIKKIDK